MDGTIPTPSPEKQPQPVVGGEALNTTTLEAKPAAAAETKPSGPRADDGAIVAQAQVAATANQGDDSQAMPQKTTAPLPATAADVDVIEPEWVKKAEEAVAANRDDPHKEEAAVEALQVEYLKARYNIDVKPSEDKP
jgi:hypothetical protein